MAFGLLRMRHCQGLVHLKRLYLENNPLVKLPNNIFDELTSLEILNLENTSLSILDSDFIKYNPGLRPYSFVP